MEAPNSFDADAIRTEKAKVVEAIRRLKPEEAALASVRAQYGAGRIDGRKVAAYRHEPDVATDSQTETFVALKLMIDNWRWSGVPFYIRTGKSMAERRTEIAIQFKRVPDVLFRDTPDGCPTADQMVCRIQPNEGISLRFVAKRPGRAAMQLADVEMNFSYDDFFKREPSTGYETLIHDCLLGDPTLFQRADNIEAGWAAVQPFLDAWAHHKGRLAAYAAGSSGPKQADALISGESCGWRSLD
jgi:glucose-6-phosphate 1-dehydrogenase